MASDGVRGGGGNFAGALILKKVHEARRWKVRREEAGRVAGGAGDGFSGEATAADCAFHCGRPAGKGPVAGEVEVIAGGVGRGAEMVKARRDGKGGAGFLKDCRLEEFGF